MRPTQMELAKRVKWAMMFIVLVAMILIRPFGNLVLSLLFGAFIVAFPFWLEKFVRTKAIPYIDSLNRSETRYNEDFPVELRVTIWAFVGVVIGAFWTILVPLIFVLPLWVNWIARNIFSFERFSWGYWHWGWLVTFLLQYAVGFIAGWFNNEYDSFEDRFEYPNE